MPDVPKADIIAVAQAALAVAVAFGAPLNPDQQKSLLALATVIAAAQKPKVVPQAFVTGTTTASAAPSGSSYTIKGSKFTDPGAGTAGIAVGTPAKPKPRPPAARKKPAPKKAP